MDGNHFVLTVISVFFSFLFFPVPFLLQAHTLESKSVPDKLHRERLFHSLNKVSRSLSTSLGSPRCWLYINLEIAVAVTREG